ncbi:MAG: hypothetical protein JW727_05015 [Candidatus Aenigmarchaeota archaeon]|nr:hypothetical protein [Candidatus Aenigmarchaeota archaeon]
MPAETISEHKPDEGQKQISVEERQFAAVKEFCTSLLENYRPLIKSIWMLSHEQESEGAILVIIFDDTKTVDHITLGTLKLKAFELEKKVHKSHRIGIHTSFYLLSDYWDLIRHGSPTTFCEIREGIPLYDPSGFFVPLKRLLAQGKIPGTKEAIYDLISRAPTRVRQIENSFKARVLEHLFNAIVEGGQAPLILAGVAPPIPKKLAEGLQVHFVDKGLLEQEYVKYVQDVFAYWKKYEHGESGLHWGDIDDFSEKTSRFVVRMQRLMEHIDQENQRKQTLPSQKQAHK